MPDLSSYTHSPLPLLKKDPEIMAHSMWNTFHPNAFISSNQSSQEEGSLDWNTKQICLKALEFMYASGLSQWYYQAVKQSIEKY